MEDPPLESVREFVRQSVDDVCQFPHMFVGTAEMLAGLIEGLDAMRRFCDGTSAAMSWHGFTDDWEQKGIPESGMMELLDARLTQQGILNPTEKERMRVLVEIWLEVTGYQVR
jgi:hypothetical protein